MTDAGSFAGNVLLFGRVLRAAGVDVHHARLLDSIRALEWMGIADRRDVAATLRSLLVHRHDDIPRFDEAFEAFFRAHRAPACGPPAFSIGERPRIVARPVPGTPIQVEIDTLESGRLTTDRAVGAWSAAGLSRTKPFPAFTPEELERARALLERLPWSFSPRRTRRWRRASSGAVDLRPLLRENLTRAGELLTVPRRRRRDAPRPIVLIGDVSGSMERYSRLLLHFMAGIARSAARVETFLFATRLTRLTPQLARRRGPGGFAAVVGEVRDWGGGTQIGESLRAFNLHWARRVMRNGPVVVIVSDGWDRGDPALIDRELARVHRSCRRLIWLNPLLGSARYEPLTRGMLAALRHVDDFLPVHNLASLEELAVHLRSLGGNPKRGR